VRPKPFQDPHPPIRVGITSAETFPIIGRMGYPIFINPSRVFALSELAEYIREYQSAWKDAGHPGKGAVGLRLPVYLAETQQQAYEEPMDSTLVSMQGIAQRVAESASREGTTGNWQAQADRIRNMTYDDWRRDKVVFGTPDAVLDRLLELREELQLSQIVFEHNLGRRIPYDQQMTSLGLLVDQVIPHLK
jgi:alkanesulfonate monooxygenase SsuD/methylene tetrahydromethanopterin reductase-like flavin-dependent oxidoreductase (luciferase family)